MPGAAEGVALELRGQEVDVGAVEPREEEAVAPRGTPEEPAVPAVADDRPLGAALRGPDPDHPGALAPPRRPEEGVPAARQPRVRRLGGPASARRAERDGAGSTIADIPVVADQGVAPHRRDDAGVVVRDLDPQRVGLEAHLHHVAGAAVAEAARVTGRRARDLQVEGEGAAGEVERATPRAGGIPAPGLECQHERQQGVHAGPGSA